MKKIRYPLKCSIEENILQIFLFFVLIHPRKDQFICVCYSKKIYYKEWIYYIWSVQDCFNPVVNMSKIWIIIICFVCSNIKYLEKEILVQTTDFLCTS